jgi:hypothetical protein
MRVRTILFLVFLSSSAASLAGAQQVAAPATARPLPDLPAGAPPSPALPATAPPPPPAGASSQPLSVTAPTPAPSAIPQALPASPEGTPPPVSAQPPQTLPPAEADDAAAPYGGRLAMWRLEVGYRGSFVPNSGYDAFSTNDSLPEFSVAATRTLFTAHPVSFAAGLAWDFGSSSATDRGDHAWLGIQRLTVPLEGRAHFGVWGYAFLRAAPGALSLHSEIDDAAAPAALSKTTWLFATDLSAGYAFLAWPRTGPAPRQVNLWLQADGGYSWVAQERLDLGPALASGDARIASGVDLGTISLSGPFFRVAAAASF